MQVLLAIRTFLIKLDGYRASAVKTAGKVHLRSRNDSDFNRRYPAVVQAHGGLPDETVIKSEIVALEESGTPPSTPATSWISKIGDLLLRL